MRTTLKLEGLREFDDAIAELTKGTARNVLRRAALDAAAPMVERMQQLAPKKTGKLQAGIAATVLGGGSPGKAAFAGAKSSGASDGEARAAAKAAGSGPLSVVVSVGSTGAYGKSIAHLDEFGTSHSAPRPFIRPGFDQTKDEVIGRIKGSLKAEIDKAASRAARKAARFAAKG